MPQKKLPRSLAASASSSSSSAVAARVDAAPGRLAAVAMTSSSSSPLVPASARQLRGRAASSHLPLAQLRRARCLLLPISHHCQQDKDSGGDGRARCGTSGARCGHGGAQKVDAIKVPSPPPVQPTVSLPNSLPYSSDRVDGVRACTTRPFHPSVSRSFCKNNPVEAWRQRPRRLARRRGSPVVRGSDGYSSSVVRQPSPSRRLPDPMRAGF